MNASPITDRTLFDELTARNPGVMLRTQEERVRQRAIVRMLARIATFGATNLITARSSMELRDAATTGQLRLVIGSSAATIVVATSLSGGGDVEVRPLPPAVLSPRAARMHALNFRDAVDLAADLETYLDSFVAPERLTPREAALLHAQSEADRLRALQGLDPARSS